MRPSSQSPGCRPSSTPTTPPGRQWSDGLPGVAGIGEKGGGAAGEVRKSQRDRRRGGGPGVRAGLGCARKSSRQPSTSWSRPPSSRSCAPKLPEFDGRIREFSPEREADIQSLSEQWGLSSSMERALTSLRACNGDGLHEQPRGPRIALIILGVRRCRSSVLVWVGQGLSLIPGSVMSGDRTWFNIGLIVGLVGIVAARTRHPPTARRQELGVAADGE